MVFRIQEPNQERVVQSGAHSAVPIKSVCFEKNGFRITCAHTEFFNNESERLQVEFFEIYNYNVSEIFKLRNKRD